MSFCFVEVPVLQELPKNKVNAKIKKIENKNLSFTTEDNE
jgi:hypothetical protein